MEFLEKYKKTLDTKPARILKTAVIIFKKSSTQFK